MELVVPSIYKHIEILFVVIGFSAGLIILYFLISNIDIFTGCSVRKSSKFRQSIFIKANFIWIIYCSS